MQEEMSKYVLSILVENNFGVLRRVSNLFARRGYNIESLSVGTTEDERISRITVVVFANKQMIDQIQKQLFKLVEVLNVELLNKNNSVYRELVFIRVKVDEDKRAELLDLAKVFRIRIVDVHLNYFIFECTGDSNKVQAAIDTLEPYGIVDITRTGLTAIRRSKYIENSAVEGGIENGSYVL